MHHFSTNFRTFSIPLLSQIITVCDIFDALISVRSYKPGLPTDRAFEILYQGAEKGEVNIQVVNVLKSIHEQVDRRNVIPPSTEKPQPRTRPVSFRLATDVYEKMAKLAEASNLSPGSMARQIVVNHVIGDSAHA